MIIFYFLLAANIFDPQAFPFLYTFPHAHSNTFQSPSRNLLTPVSPYFEAVITTLTDPPVEKLLEIHRSTQYAIEQVIVGCADISTYVITFLWTHISLWCRLHCIIGFQRRLSLEENRKPEKE